LKYVSLLTVCVRTLFHLQSPKILMIYAIKINVNECSFVTRPPYLLRYYLIISIPNHTFFQ